MKQLSTKTLNKINRMATKAINKTMGKAFSRLSLADQCKAIIRITNQLGAANTRNSLLKDDAMPEEIKDMYKKGWQVTQIKDYYWSCPDFRALWNLLDMNEEFLDLLIENSIKERG